MENKKTVEEFIVPLYHVELVREKNLTARYASSVEAVAQIFHEMLDSSPVEKLAVIHCNSSGDMSGAEIVGMGSLEMVSAQMRDLLRGAILNNAASIWVAHNHVSGSVRASLPDYTFTLLLREACFIMQVPLNDHLVIAPGEHFSIKEHAADLDREYQTQKFQQSILEKMRAMTGGNFPGVPDDGFLDFLLPPKSSTGRF